MFLGLRISTPLLRAVWALSVISSTLSLARGSARDAGSSTLLTKSGSALGATSILQGLVLTGTVQYSAGSEQDSGAIEMKAAGAFDASVRLHLSNGERREISHADAGQWFDSRGGPHTNPLHNVLMAPNWFSPVHIVQAWLTDEHFLVSNLGQEDLNGKRMDRLRCVRVFPRNNASSNLLQTATAVEMLVDDETDLPAQLEFNTHPDENELKNIPIRIEFSDYRKGDAGVLTPFHIQKYLQGTLLLDIFVQSADINPAIAANEFLLQ
jgi:hypothetical protein